MLGNLDINDLVVKLFVIILVIMRYNNLKYLDYNVVNVIYKFIMLKKRNFFLNYK